MFPSETTLRRPVRMTSNGMLSHQPGEVLFEVGLEHLDADTLDSGGPAVLANGAECVGHDSGRDPSGQRMVLDLERLDAVHPVIPESGLCRSVGHARPWKMLLRATRGDRVRTGPKPPSVCHWRSNCLHGLG